MGSTNTPCGLGGDENEVYFCTWDLKETLRRVVEAGGSVEKEVENSVGRAAKVRDNQGTAIWFQEPRKMAYIYAFNIYIYI